MATCDDRPWLFIVEIEACEAKAEIPAIVAVFMPWIKAWEIAILDRPDWDALRIVDWIIDEFRVLLKSDPEVIAVLLNAEDDKVVENPELIVEDVEVDKVIVKEVLEDEADKVAEENAEDDEEELAEPINWKPLRKLAVIADTVIETTALPALVSPREVLSYSWLIFSKKLCSVIFGSNFLR